MACKSFVTKKLCIIPLVWQLALLYFLWTTIIVLSFDANLFLSPSLLQTRLLFLIMFISLMIIKRWLPESFFTILNIIIVYALLPVLYKETVFLNTIIFQRFDLQLSEIDYAIFGFQPSIEFSKLLHHCFFKEMFFFGYFSYYLMPVIILYFLYRFKSYKVEAFGFMLIGSFFMYYILFVLFPAAGPQYYFPYPANAIDACGFFGKTIQYIQKAGEGPTGAFPSSHVGLSVIMSIWLYYNYPKLAKYFLPVVLLLIFSTVYIKAHYAIDVFAGIISAPVIYFIQHKLFEFLQKKKTHAHNN